MRVINRSSFRRSWTLLTAIALPLPLLGCVGDFANNSALLPLQAACDGEPVPQAAEYDPKVPTPPATAIIREEGELVVQNSLLGTGTARGEAVGNTQLVVCVEKQPPITLKMCNYGDHKIKRQGQTARVKLVAAKTGQALGAQSFFGEAQGCPRALRVRRGAEPETRVYEADANLDRAIIEWTPGAIASAQPMDKAAVDAKLTEDVSDGKDVGQGSTAPKPEGPSPLASDALSNASPVTSAPETKTEASADAKDIKAQCDALNEATRTEFGYGYGAQLSAESGTIYLSESDSSVRVAVSLGQKNMDKDLTEIDEAIAITKDVPLQEPELLTFRDQFLSGLMAMKENLQRFQKLSTAAVPYAKVRPVAREDLKPIADKMAPLAATIKKQSETLEETKSQIFSRCLKLKRR